MEQHRESYGEKEVLAVFRRTDHNGNFLYTTEQATAATVYCTLSLVSQGHFTMATLPGDLGQLLARYITDKKIPGGAPDKVRAQMIAQLDKDIPVGMMRDLNEALAKISRDGGVAAAEELARQVAPRRPGDPTDGKLPGKSATGAGLRNRKN